MSAPGGVRSLMILSDQSMHAFDHRSRFSFLRARAHPCLFSTTTSVWRVLNSSLFSSRLPPLASLGLLRRQLRDKRGVRPATSLVRLSSRRQMGYICSYRAVHPSLELMIPSLLFRVAVDRSYPFFPRTKGVALAGGAGCQNGVRIAVGCISSALPCSIFPS